MNAPRPTLGHSRSTAAVSPGAGVRSWWLSPRGRALLSVLIFLHLLAVIGEPMRMFSQGRQPGSPEAQLVRSGLAPYIDFVYLHHGYFFFAPNPGPSHLMDIKLSDADGSVRRLRLPNHRAQWPRLLYHRHFMLSEFLYQLYTPAPSDLSPDMPVSEALVRDRALFERVRASMEEHLAVRYGAQKAEIQLMEHRLPNAVEVFDRGMKLNDEQLYLLLPDRPEPPASVEPLPAAKNQTPAAQSQAPGQTSGPAAGSEQAAASGTEASPADSDATPSPSNMPARTDAPQAEPAPQPEEVRP